MFRHFLKSSTNRLPGRSTNSLARALHQQNDGVVILRGELAIFGLVKDGRDREHGFPSGHSWL